MSEYDVVVIGAGNGGLSSACTLAQGGVKTLLLEQHNVPGGYATSFCRGRFEFEVALHQLSGLGSPTNPGPLRKMLDELGVTGLLKWVDMKNLYRIIVPGLFDITLPANREATIEVLKKKFPEESENIEAFFELVYKCWNEFSEMYQYNFDSVDIESRLDPEASAEKYPTFFKYAFQNLENVLNQHFKNPLLKMTVAAFSAYSGPPREICLIDLATWLFFYIEYGSYHIKGGSQALSNAIVKRFQENGGEIRFNCGVSKILVENGSTTGVVAESGETIEALYIVSNVSPLTVYTELIDRGHVPKGQLDSFKGSIIGPGTFILYVGLDCEHSQLGIDETTNFVFAPKSWMMFSCYNVSNPECSPPGTSVVTIIAFVGNERQWLGIPPDQYFEKKYEFADMVLGQMEQICPGFREHIEEIEVATPLTNMRYARAPGGAIGGFKHYSKDFYLFPMNRSLIEGLHFVGAWANNPGGFHPTLMNGRAVGLDILKKLKKDGSTSREVKD